MIERVIGETVGSYRIVSRLSSGGMGAVYKAEHTIIGKLAAVKVLLPELSTNREIVNRFLKEAQATTTIKHPGIVDVIDFGYMPSGEAFLVMEFLEGMSLARRLKQRGNMSEGEAAMMLRAVCAALAAAHGKGIVHRDLKPDNIFMVPDPESATGERPKLLDFGIAKLTDVGKAGTATRTGMVMGTPTYMSPEQCRGTGEVDHRADLYSIGCIFYEVVTGRPPFIEEGAGELIGAHLFLEPDRASVHAPGLSPETEGLIMSLLHKRPDQRPQTAKELGQRLAVLAQQHGWITATSPTGVTAPALATTPGDGGGDRPSKPAGVTTPYGSPAPVRATPASGAPAVAPAPGTLERWVESTSPPAEQPVDKPTTLTLASTQSASHDVPRRSRKTFAIAMVAAVGLAGGLVGVVALNGGERTGGASSAGASSPAPSTGPDLTGGTPNAAPATGTSNAAAAASDRAAVRGEQPANTAPATARSGASNAEAAAAATATPSELDTSTAAATTTPSKAASPTGGASKAAPTSPPHPRGGTATGGHMAERTGDAAAPIAAKKKPPRPPVKKPEPKKKPTLIETDIE